MDRTLIKDTFNLTGKTVEISGWVHRIRDLGGIIFIILRDRTGELQLVSDSFTPSQESVITARGTIQENPKAPGGLELKLEQYTVLAEAHPELPIAVNQDPGNLALDTILDNRMLSIRSPKILTIFKVQARILESFASFFRSQDFLEIKSSKIIGGGSEGGSNLFTLDYFGQNACLAQSPQLYKQTMISSGLERVFEIGHVYRAEKHETPRHINEYVSLDIEMAFIEDEQPLIQIESQFLADLFETLNSRCSTELKTWNTTVPKPESCTNIPVLAYDRARDIVKKTTGKRVSDINPEAERILCDWAMKEHGTELVFINEFPLRKRPFYTFPDGHKTKSFDLLFRGLEITTGGRRINEYPMFLQAVENFGIQIDQLGSYPDIFRFGCPPHGGFAIGLERLTQKILGLANVREATLFPRDRKRLFP